MTKTSFAPRMVGTWDESCNASLRKARDKALSAGTLEALNRFRARLDRLHNNTTMPQHIYISHSNAIDEALIKASG